MGTPFALLLKLSSVLAGLTLLPFILLGQHLSWQVSDRVLLHTRLSMGSYLQLHY